MFYRSRDRPASQQYLDEMWMAEAKREIDTALSVDPSFDVALVAREWRKCAPCPVA